MTAERQDVESPQAPSYSADPVRSRLAHIYLSGEGVEFGALHAGLAMPPGARVRYADFADATKLHAFFPDQRGIRAPDIITSLESMDAITPASLDFIVANHVLEHTENPLRALKAIASRLKPGGIAYLALPDKRYTFDIQREITSLAHIVRDENEGPEWSAFRHYEEWVTLVDGLSGAQREAKIREMLETRANIHYHVWDLPAMQEMFDYLNHREDIELQTIEHVVNGIEVIWLLERSKTPISAARQLPPPTACLVCGKSAFETFAPASLASYPVYLCGACGFAFAWPRVAQDFTHIPEEACFDECFMEHAPGNAALARELDRTARDLMAVTGAEPEAALHAPSLEEKGAAGTPSREPKAPLAPPRLVDVGCAGGVLLPYFRALGWQVEGVDPWLAAAKAGRKYLSAPITMAKLADAGLAIHAYDFVLVLDTLQFVEDPRDFLRSCCALLREGGVMMIETPNFHSEEFRMRGADASMFLPAHHISYFCAENLSAMLAEMGCVPSMTLIYGGESQDSRLRVWARRL